MIQIEACKRGDRKALSELYMAYAHKLRGICRHYVKDESAVEDILHDAFVVIFMSLKDLKDDSKLEGWLVTIVRNLSLRYLHSMGRKELSLSQFDIDIPDNEANEERENVELEVILSAIDHLPKASREVFKLSVLDGLSHKEIGEKLGIAPHSSSSQLFRAKKLLRTMLSDYWLLLLMPVLTPLYLYFFARHQYERKVGNSPIMVRSRRDGMSIPLNVGREKQEPAKDDIANTVYQPLGSSRAQKKMEEAMTDTTLVFTENTLDSCAIVPNIAPPQKQHSVDSRVVDSLLHLLGRTPVRLTATHLHMPLKKEQRKTTPWTFNFGYSSNGGSNGSLSGLGDLSVVDYANGGAAARLYTWKDYESYLARNYALMDSVERAKMSWIAQNRITDENASLDEKVHHHRPTTLGLSVTKQLSSRWIFGTGLTYTSLKSEFESEFHSATLVKTQKIGYVGLPIRLTYCMWGKGRLSAYTLGGVTFEVPVHSSLEKKYTITSDSTFTLKGEIRPRPQWSVNLGLGVQYKIFKPFSLFVEPNVYYYFGNGSGIETYRTEHPFFFTVPFGVRLTW